MTSVPGAHEYSVGDMAAELAQHYPRATATICGDITHTHAELFRRATTLAIELSADGVGAGDRLLWIGQNCHRLLETLAAASLLGASVCPVNWRLSVPELQFIYSDLKPAVAFIQGVDAPAEAKAFVGQLPASQRAYYYDGTGAGSYEALLARGSAAPDWPDVEGRAAVLIIYGMAWEGDPNGSMLSSDNLLLHAAVQADLQDIDRHTVLLASGPLFHIGMWQTLIPVWMYGGTLVMSADADAARMAELIDAHQVTLGYLMPPTAEKILALPDADDYDLSTLRSNLPVPGWAERVSADVTAWAALPVRVYGQTEAGGSMAYGALGYAEGYRMCGRPAPGYRTRILGLDGHPVPAGQVGEIAVRGPYVHLGYWNRPDLNQERWRGGWWHTGDLGFIDEDGILIFVGPKGRLVKSGAENIFPAEVERALESHPLIREAAVIGRPDPAWGQNVVAIVVLAGGELTEAEVIDHCRAQLASYKKPKVVIFRTDPLPRSAVGAKRHAVLDAEYGGGGYPGV
jgi:acyl-CoA synthetase (AMP-forming)/AMP-acid ligase II